MSSPFTVSFGEDSARLGFNSLRLTSQRFDSALFDSFIDYEDQYSVMDGGFVEYLVDSPPPPAEGPNPIPPEKGFALGEWRRQNAIRLEEKERKEKEMLKVIIEEADKYKAELYKKWRIECDISKALSRDKEKKFLQDRDKFHAEASKSFWKATAQLIPRQVEKKPTIVVIQGPKPGKPTDLSRMRQLLDTLKQAGETTSIT